MARVLYGQGVAGFKGSIAGTTFSRNSSGNIAYSKPYPRISFYPLRTNNLVNLAYFNSHWFQLEPVERAAWDFYAKEHAYIDPFGTQKRINGKSWFIHLNYNRSILGKPFLLTPPDYIIPPDFPDCWPALINNEWFLASHQDPLLPEHVIFLFFTLPCQRTTLYFKNKLRFIIKVDSFPNGRLYLQELLSEYFLFSYPIPSEPPEHEFTCASFCFYVNIYTGHSGKGFLAYYGMP